MKFRILFITDGKDACVKIIVASWFVAKFRQVGVPQV